MLSSVHSEIYIAPHPRNKGLSHLVNLTDVVLGGIPMHPATALNPER